MNIRSEGVILERKNDAGVVVMSATAVRALTVAPREGGPASSNLETVKGKLFRDGKVASNFAAPRAKASEDNRTLDLTGGVRVTSEQYRLVMTADRMVWTENTGLIEAIGNVWLRGENFESGPSPRLVTTPELQRLGTPDRFRP